MQKQSWYTCAHLVTWKVRALPELIGPKFPTCEESSRGGTTPCGDLGRRRRGYISDDRGEVKLRRGGGRGRRRRSSEEPFTTENLSTEINTWLKTSYSSYFSTVVWVKQTSSTYFVTSWVNHYVEFVPVPNINQRIITHFPCFWYSWYEVPPPPRWSVDLGLERANVHVTTHAWGAAHSRTH